MKSKTPTTSHLAIALFLTLTAAVFAVESSSKSLTLFSTPAEAAAPVFVDQSFVRKLDVQANDLVVDPATQTIYATLPSTNGSNGNSIAPIDPNSGTLGTPVFIGSEPNKMAISDNGQFIYVGLTGGFAVRRFDVATQTAGPQFSLGVDFLNGPIQAGEIAVQTGNPHTVAVYRPTVGGIAIFDDGVQRTSTAGAPFNASIAFSTTDLARLYALGANSLSRLNVTLNGISSVTPQTITGSGAAKLSGGKLYTSSGHAIDPETGSLLGTFTGANSTTAFVPDSNVKRVYFLSGPFSSGGVPTVTLRVYDQETFLPIATLDIPNVSGTPTEMVRWGTNGLAFCTTGGNVFLIQTTLVSAQDPIPSSTPTPSPTATPSPTPTPTPGPTEFRQLALTTNDLAATAGAETIFASVPSSAGASGNSVTPIDAVAGTAGASVFIGSEPNKLALSSDGGTLWVALDGANGVRRFDVGSRTPGLQFSLGADPFFGPFRAEDMAVAPGQPDVLAVSRLRTGVTPRHGGVAVFDKGVQRTLTTPDHTGSNVIEFSQSPEVLYGQNTESTEFGFRKMAVAPCGCITVATTQSLLSNGFGSDFRADNGLVYATSGRVVDPESRTVQGTFTLRNPNTSGFNATLVVPDSKAGRVYFVLDENGNILLRVFDIKTFLKIGELQLPGVTGTISSLIRWGTNGLAFRTPTQVFLLQNALIGGQDPNFVAAPPPPSPTLTAGVQVTSGADPSGVTISVTGSFTTSGTTNANGFFQLNGIPPCGTYTVTATKPNYQMSPPSITVTNPSSAGGLNFFALRKTIGFQTSSISQSEQVNRIFVFVSRNTSTEPASVVYRTIPGTASDRSDFNSTFGKLDFAVNESTKSIQVLMTDDVLVEGPEQFTLQLQDATGADLVQGSITVTINDNDSVTTTINPLTNAQFFVRQHYQDFLNRAAADDQAGFDFWTSEITSCNNLADPALRSNCLAVKRINVSGAFFLSIEFQETGYFVHRLYTSSFPANAARPRGLPRFAEFLTDTQQIGAGVVVGSVGWEQKLEQNKQAFVLSWISRPEFLSEHPLSQTADQFVDSLFQNNGVTPTPAERAAAITLFGAGDAAGRAAALRSVAESQSVNKKQFNPAFVLMQYFGYLRRNPDDAPDNNFNGYQFWLDKLNQFNGNFIDAEMVKAFLTSFEYQQRFGPTTFDLSQ